MTKLEAIRILHDLKDEVETKEIAAEATRQKEEAARREKQAEAIRVLLKVAGDGA